MCTGLQHFSMLVLCTYLLPWPDLYFSGFSWECLSWHLSSRILHGFGTGLCLYQPSELGVLQRGFNRTFIWMCHMTVKLSSTTNVTLLPMFAGPYLKLALPVVLTSLQKVIGNFVTSSLWFFELISSSKVKKKKKKKKSAIQLPKISFMKVTMPPISTRDWIEYRVVWQCSKAGTVAKPNSHSNSMVHMIHLSWYKQCPCWAPLLMCG